MFPSSGTRRNLELYNFCSSQDTVVVITWGERVGRGRGVGESERILGRPRHRWRNGHLLSISRVIINILRRNLRRVVSSFIFHLLLIIFPSFPLFIPFVFILFALILSFFVLFHSSLLAFLVSGFFLIFIYLLFLSFLYFCFYIIFSYLFPCFVVPLFL